MDPVLAQLIGAISVTCVVATFGFTVLNFVRSGMGARLERLEKSDAECQQDRLRLERERIQLLEEIARMSVHSRLARPEELP